MKHSRPHRDTSTEFHTPSGPFTLVPLPGNRSSLVWVLDPADADAIAALGDAELSVEIERASHSILGKIEVEAGARNVSIQRRHRAEVSPTSASRWWAKRLMSSHRSARRDSISVCATPPASANWPLPRSAMAADIGGADVLTAYDKMRRTDVGSRTLAIDLLNRTLLTDFLPVQGMRRPRPLHDRPHRPAAPRSDARRRRARRRATAADARRGIL